MEAWKKGVHIPTDARITGLDIQVKVLEVYEGFGGMELSAVPIERSIVETAMNAELETGVALILGNDQFSLFSWSRPIPGDDNDDPERMIVLYIDPEEAIPGTAPQGPSIRSAILSEECNIKTTTLREKTLEAPR